MLRANVFARKRTANGNDSQGVAVITENSNGHNLKIDFEMNLHVPCRCEGKQENGATWKGEVTTLSISSFGAHLLMPVDVDLQDDVELTFKVPVPLLTLFPKRKFQVLAKLKPADIAAPSSATMGRKVVRVAFAQPLYFRSK